MISGGKVQVVVRSRRVPTSLVSISQPVYTLSGIRLGSQKIQRLVYGSVFDEEHQEAIEEGRKLADRLGLDLEVVDTSKLGLARRILASLGGNLSQGPALVVSPSSGEPAVTLARGATRVERSRPAPSVPQAACSQALTPKLFTTA